MIYILKYVLNYLFIFFKDENYNVKLNLPLDINNDIFLYKMFENTFNAFNVEELV